MRLLAAACLASACAGFLVERAPLTLVARPSAAADLEEEEEPAAAAAPGKKEGGATLAFTSPKRVDAALRKNDPLLFLASRLIRDDDARRGIRSVYAWRGTPASLLPGEREGRSSAGSRG